MKNNLYNIKVLNGFMVGGLNFSGILLVDDIVLIATTQRIQEVSNVVEMEYLLDIKKPEVSTCNILVGSDQINA